MPCGVLIGAPGVANAQACSTNPSNGGILQSGGTCVEGNAISTGFGNAVDASDSANVTTNGTITAGGGGNGIVAATGATVTANGDVNASSIALSAASGATITVNNIALGNTGGGAMAVLSDNASIFLNNVTMVWPNGFGAALVEATNGGLVQFTNSSIDIPSGSVPAVLLATGAGSRIIANDFLTLQIGATGATRGVGQGNSAIRAQSGGSVEIPDGGSITMLTGGGNTGLLAVGAGSSITAANLTELIGTGGGDAGAVAVNGGQVTLNGGSVTIPGAGGAEVGLAAIGAGSLVTASAVTINVSGAAANAGVNVQNGGTVVTSGGSVSVVNGAGGLLQNGGTVTMTGTNVTASGAGGIGFLFDSGPTETLTYRNGTITASDASFSVQGATANISLANAVATTNNNTLLATTSTGDTTFNAQASTLRGVITTDASSTSTVNLTQQTVWTMTGNSNATNVTNDSSQITYTPPTSDPTLLSSYKTLTANNYTGVGGSITLNTYLGNDSSPSDRLVINGGTGTGSTALKIVNTTGPGDLTTANGILVVQTLNSATTTASAFSLANRVRAGAYDYFLFRGGINGSAPQDWFLRSTFIVPPLSPSTQPAALLPSMIFRPSTQPATIPPSTISPPSTQPIQVPPGTISRVPVTTQPIEVPPGTISRVPVSTQPIQVPPGTITTVPITTQPIEVPPGTISRVPVSTQPIQVPPGTIPRSPITTQPIEVPPGTVSRSPISTEPIQVPPGRIPSPGPPPPSTQPSLAAPSVLPPDPPPAVLPPGTFPIIGPELATYGTVQPMARQIGLATLGTLNQRIGDTMTVFNAGTDPSGWGRSDWGRFFGQQVNGHYQAFADPRTDGWLAGFQGGVDLWRGSTAPGHRDAAGVYFAYTEASANVTGLITNPAATGYILTRTGTNDIQAYSAGGYWTHYGPTGWYLDAIMQGTLYRGDTRSAYARLPTNGSGFVASLETGYPIPLPLGPGFVFEPQAQIIWQQVKFDDTSDSFGPVRLGATSGPIGRVGLRGQWNIVGSNGMLWQPYAGVNYWQSWGAEATTSFGIDQVKLLENLQTVEAFVGITGRLDRNFSVYAQAGYQFDVNDAAAAGAKGTAGIRYSW